MMTDADQAAATASSPWVAFAGQSGEICGGYHDHFGTYDDETSALEACRRFAEDGGVWWHIVHDGRIVHDCDTENP